MQTTGDVLELSTADIILRASRLTPAQIKTIAQTMKGKSDKEIAFLLAISQRTVRHHLHDARIRTGAESRNQLVALFAIWQYTTRNNSYSGHSSLAENFETLS